MNDPLLDAILTRRDAIVASGATLAGLALPFPAAAQDVRKGGTLVIASTQTPRHLNGAVQSGVDQLARAGVRRVVVAHADLPRAAGLASIADGDGVVLVPDRRHDGTNVAVVPTAAGFRFSYGPGSFDRHREEARRLGLRLRVVEDPRLAFDVDVPDDLDALTARRNHH